MEGISLLPCLNQPGNNGDDREAGLISFVSYSADNGGLCGVLKARLQRWPGDDFILQRFIKGPCQSNSCWETGEWPSGSLFIREQQAERRGEKSLSVLSQVEGRGDACGGGFSSSWAHTQKRSKREGMCVCVCEKETKTETEKVREMERVGRRVDGDFYLSQCDCLESILSGKTEGYSCCWPCREASELFPWLWGGKGVSGSQRGLI